MKIGDIYTENTTFKSTVFTKNFIIDSASDMKITPAEFCRNLMENISRSKNGLVQEILSIGITKEKLIDEIYNQPIPPSFFDTEVKREVKKRKVKRKRKVNSNVIHHMRLPDRSEALTHNLKAFMRDWCKANGIEGWEKIFESAKTGFKNEKVTKTQRSFRSRYPYIKFKYTRDSNGDFRRFKKGQTSHARVIDIEELYRILPEKYEFTIPPNKKKIGLRKKKKIDTIYTEEDKCPLCGGQLISMDGPYGEFFACSNYIKTGCRFTIGVKVDNDKALKALGAEEPKTEKPKTAQEKWIEKNGGSYF